MVEGCKKGDDVLDDLAQLVLSKGGNVFVLPTHQIPKFRVVVAICDPKLSDASTEARVVS